MPNILLSRIPRTYVEGATIVLAEDMSFIKGLYEAKNTELHSEVTFNTYWDSSLYSLAAFGKGTSWLWTTLPWRGTLGRGNMKP